MLAATILGFVRRSKIALPLFLVTFIHCALVWPTRSHLGAMPATLAEQVNIGSVTFAMAAAVGFALFRDSSFCFWALAFAINSGPLGELAMWPGGLHKVAA